MGLLNKLTVSNALNPNLAGSSPVIALNSDTNSMPKEGSKLLANGYKLHSVVCDNRGRYSWIFVIPEYAI